MTENGSIISLIINIIKTPRLEKQLDFSLFKSSAKL